jgi:hypothetical protein
MKTIHQDPTKKLIAALSKDSRTQKKKTSLFTFLLSIFIICLFMIVAMALNILPNHFRADIRDKLHDTRFLLQLSLLFLMGSLSAIAAYTASIPGREIKYPVRILYFSIVLSLILFTIPLFSLETLSLHLGFPCLKDVFLFGLAPALIVFLIIRSLAPLNRVRIAILCSLTAFAYGSIGSQLTCSNENALHILVWHFAPIMIFSLIGGLLGSRLFKKL